MTARLVLVMAVALALGLVLISMWVGWAARQKRQRHIPEPPLLTEQWIADSSMHQGRYLGTSFADSWLTRVVVHALGTPSAASIGDSRHVVAVVRPTGGFGIRVDDIVDVRLDKAAGGKAYSPQGVVVVGWLLGSTNVETSFRLDDVAAHPSLVAEIAKACASRKAVSS